jgi:lysophospholipase
VGNLLTSDPVRYARNAAVLEADPSVGLGAPTVGWAAAAFKAMRQFAETGYASAIRQPLLLIAAGRDEVVSATAAEDFALHLRAGSHLVVPGSRHELLQEQDAYRAQFWAAFDAFVPGTPLFG